MRAKKADRQSNIELLRILAILGVVVLHYNNPILGGGMTYASEGGLNFYLLYFLESCFICAVDLFMLISGYFLIESKSRNIWRVIELIVQVMIFNFGMYMINTLIGTNEFSIRHAINSLIPSNYFVILYCLVFLISPFINKLMKVLGTKQLNTFMLVLFLVFSVYPTLVDVLGELVGKEIMGLSSLGAYGSQWGYSAVNFMLMYCLGAYLRMEGIDKWSRKKALLSFGICALISLLWSRANDFIGYFTEKSAYEYCNPIVILMAISIFIVFAKTDIGEKKWINQLAKGAFTVYLTHGFFIRHVGIESFVQGNVLFMVLHMIVVACGLYLIGYICFVLYDLITKPIWGVLENRIKIAKIEID